MAAKLSGSIKLISSVSIVNTTQHNFDLDTGALEPDASGFIASNGGSRVGGATVSAITLTGMVAVDLGRLMAIDSQVGGQVINVSAESGSSTANHRFAHAITLNPGAALFRPACITWYDPISSRWRQVGGHT